MWWLVTLLVLALVSFFFVKSMKASTEKKQAEHNDMQRETLGATSASQEALAADDSTSTVQAAAGVATVAAVTGGAASKTPVQSGNSSTSVNTGDTLSDVREMIKILNLDGPDATRLELSREELTALRKGDNSGIPDASSLENVATKLRQMLA